MSVLRVALLAITFAAAWLPTATVQAQGADEPKPLAVAASGSGDIRALEQQVETVLAEARRQQTQLAVQRQRLAAAEAANAWLPLLFIVLAALALACGLLTLRLRRMRRQLAQLQGAGAARSSAAVPAPGAGEDLAVQAPPHPPQLSVRPLLGGLGAASLRKAAELPPTPLRTGPVLGGELGTRSRDFSFGTGAPPRPVSVEELLDLDQQVEFFLALGQAQSAINLLLGHVRSTGGTNAQPYFKLLEIYRDQGDEEAYERTRERFNQRFNAHAPDWTGDLAGGRLLEQYPEVVLRLQRAWPQPMRVLAELDGLLLRRADLEPFDLPAYRDLLMLHALVRDLPAAAPATNTGVSLADPAGQAAAMPPTAPAALVRELRPGSTAHADEAADLASGDGLDIWLPPPPAAGAALTPVDLLLPLGEEPMDITLPQPHLASRPLVRAMLADWVFSQTARDRGTGADGTGGEPGDRPSAPMRLDLDLSEYAPAPREFTRPAAFTDIDMRRDRRLSDLGGLDEAEPLPSRR